MIYDDTNNPDSNLEQVLADPTQETQQESAQEQPKPAEESLKDKNFREMREKVYKLERERDEALRYAQQFQQPQQQQAPQEDDDLQLKPDDLAEGKHLSKVQKRIKALENQLRQSEERTAQMTTEARLKAQFPDFDKVVSRENVDIFRDMEPEVFATVSSSNDLYSKAVTAYKMIKKLGIGEPDLYQKDRDIAQRNAAKPKPVASLSPQQGETPMSRANAFAEGLTPDLRKQLLKEMTEAKKGY